MAKQTCCLFCLRVSKSTHPSTDDDLNRNEDLKEYQYNRQIQELQQIFTHLLHRYLAEDKIKIDKLIYPDEKVEDVIEPCTDCSTVIKSFCDLYKEIQVLEMKLKWRLETLVNIVRSSRKVKFRLEGVQEMLRTLEVDKEKDLDMGNFMEAVKEFREDFLNKCSSKIKSSYPKVKLKKISEEMEPQKAGEQQDVELLIKTELSSTGNGRKRRKLEKHNDLPDVIELVSFPDSVTNSGTRVKLEPEIKLNCEAILNDDLTDIQDLDPNGPNDLSKSESSYGEVCDNMVLIDRNKSRKRAANVALKASHNISEEFNLISIPPEHEEMLDILNENCPMLVPVIEELENNESGEALGNEVDTNISDIEADSLQPSKFAIDTCVTTKEEVISSATVGSEADELFRQVQDEIVSVEATEVNQVKTQGAQCDNGSQSLPGAAPFIDDMDVRDDDDLQEEPLTQSQSPPPQSMVKKKAEKLVLFASPRRSSTRKKHKCSTCTKTFTSELTLKSHQETCSKLALVPFRDEGNVVGSELDNEVAGESHDDQWNEEADNVELMEEDEEGSPSSPEQSEEDLIVKGKNQTKNTCNICQVVITSRKDELDEKMQSHFKEYHDISSINPNKVRRCNYTGCSAYFLKRNYLSVHKSNFHHDKSLKNIANNFDPSASRGLKCKFPNCRERVYSKENLETHLKLHGNFQCFYCPEVKTYAPDLSLHETEMHSSEKQRISRLYTCVQCNLEVSGRLNYINHHLKLHLNLTPVTFPSCKICQFVFTPLKATKRIDRYVIIEHYEVYHNDHGMDSDSIQRCDVDDCEAYFVTPGQLRRHVRDIHFQDWKPSYKCRDCSKCFRIGKILVVHRERQHSSNWEFKCTDEHCTRRFETEELLEAHRKCHEIDEKTRYCPVCKRTFKYNGQLKSHMRTHENYKTPKEAKEYLCAICGKKSRDICRHQLHLLTHSGPETWKYSCETCGKKCMTIQKLEEHLNTHKTKDKKVFTCEHCGLTYAHRHNFRHHLKNKHGVILENPRQKKTSTAEVVKIHVS